MRTLAFSLIAMSAAACTTYTPEQDGPYYAKGYSDGCRTAEAQQAAFNTESFQDEDLFKIDGSYRAGWRVGYAECRLRSGQGVRPTSEGSLSPEL